MNSEPKKGVGAAVFGCLASLVGLFLLRAILGLLGMTVESVWPGHEGLVCGGLALAWVAFCIVGGAYVIIALLGGPRQIWPFLKWLLGGRRQR